MNKNVMQITVIAPQILRSRLAGHFLSTSCGKVQNTKAGKAKAPAVFNVILSPYQKAAARSLPPAVFSWLAKMPIKIQRKIMMIRLR